jgi:CheY-like chemotaxis protein
MKTLTILIAEDEALIGMLLAQVLEGMGHRVCGIAATEDAFVALAARENPDLLIVDAGLRGGGGVSAVDRIFQHDFIPHIFITGNLARIKALRPDSIVLEKPFIEADLERAIVTLFPA